MSVGCNVNYRKRNPGLKILPVLFLSAVTVLVMSCSGGSSSHVTTTPKPLTGIVQIPAGSPLAARQSDTLFARIAGFFFAASDADITGLAPLKGATIQLVRLDSLGNVVSVISTTISDSVTGAYTFATPPPLDSSLMVRVDPAWIAANTTEPPGTEMRAIASRSSLDISPQTESIVAMVYTNLTGGKVIGNYDNAEITSLYNLVNTMNVDVSAATTFADSVTTVTAAASPIVPDTASAFSSASRAAFPSNSTYSIVGMSTTLMDPFALGAGLGGFAAEQSSGGLGFESAGVVIGGLISGGGLRQDLTAVTTGNSIQIDPAGLEHVIANNGQLAISTDNTTAVAGFSTKPNSYLLAYPVDSVSPTAGEWLRTGARLSVKNLSGDQVVAFTDNNPATLPNVDSFFSGIFNLVSFENRMFGPISTAGTARVEAVTGTGTYTFDSLPDSFNDGTGHTTLGTANALGQNLTAPYLVTNAAATLTAPANYKKLGFTGIQLDDAFGTFVGVGQFTPDGQILAYYTARDIFQHEIDVLANDTDALNDTLKITNINVAPSGGTAVINDTKDLVVYTPPGDSLLAETFQYSLADSGGLASSTLPTATINLVQVNAPPTANATGTDTFTVNAGAVNVPLPVLDNDLDAVGDKLTIQGADAVGSAGGTITINAAKDRILYTPVIASGTETFNYTVQDSSGQTAFGGVTVNVAANTAPVGNDDLSYRLNTTGATQTLDVLANDTDATGDTLTITSVSATSAGGTVVNNGSNLSYTPPSPAFNGVDSFTYKIQDALGTPNGAPDPTVNITIGPNQAPVGNNDGLSPNTITVNVDNTGRRGLTLGIRRPAVATTNSVVNGTYNAVQIATVLNEDGVGLTGLINSEYEYGTLTFNGAGSVTGGSLIAKRDELDIAAAQSAAAPGLQALPASAAPDTLTAAGSSYTVNADGTVSATLVFGVHTITASGAVTEDGRFIALTLSEDVAGPPVQGMRGLLLLSKQ